MILGFIYLHDLQKMRKTKENNRNILLDEKEKTFFCFQNTYITIISLEGFELLTERNINVHQISYAKNIFKKSKNETYNVKSDIRKDVNLVLK